MTFNEKLAILRKIKGLTQDEFAKAVGVSRQAVYKWESGVSYPEVPKLLEIKALFSISLDELFDESVEIALPEKKKRTREKKETISEKTEIKEEPVAEKVSEAAPVSEGADEAKEVKEEKKVGFFGRLFGRK
jgi:transcriptional regulator with XRE-family HTH domain